MAKKTNKAIEAAMAALEKRYKEPVVMKMSDAHTNAETFSSGRLDLDEALGGGWGVGKIIELYAESGCGKTGLALEAIASIQKAGGTAAIIDAEHALNTEYAEQIGVDIDELYISQPSDGEQAFETIRALINTGEVNLIVVDSVSAMVPLAELEGEIGETKMAMQARMMSKGMKLIAGPANDNKCTVIFINQLREVINAHVPTKITSGGKALKFYASQRAEIKSKGWIREGEQVIGFKQHVKIVKNKIGVPFKTIDNDIVYGKGIDELGVLFEVAVQLGVFQKKGSWIAYEGENLAQGAAKLRVLLEDNPELVEEIKAKVEKVSKK